MYFAAVVYVTVVVAVAIGRGGERVLLYLRLS